jgi:hypothetical protein
VTNLLNNPKRFFANQNKINNRFTVGALTLEVAVQKKSDAITLCKKMWFWFHSIIELGSLDFYRLMIEV